MNVLMTGASGLIGSAVAQKLLEQGHRITALTRDARATQRKLGDQVNLIDSLDGLSELNDFNAVINLAGEPIADRRWSKKQKQKIESSRWDTTEKLVELIRQSKAPPCVFVSGSAVGYYGKQGCHPIPETVEPKHQNFSHRLCANWEDIALSIDSTATRVCVLRTGIVLSNNGGALSKLLVPFKLGLGGPIGSGHHFMPWIHIDDMVEGILFLLRQDNCCGAFNFTAPNPVTNREFSKTLGKVLNRPTLIPTPPVMLKLLFGEMSELLIEGQNAVPEKLQKNGYQFKYHNLADALDSLGL